MEKNKTIIRSERLTPSALHIRETDGAESRTITGYAILFGVQSAPLWSDDDSEAREVIEPEAISRDLLDASDIKMTMFHDRQLILARSNQGLGTLSYDIDDKGVSFSFEAPRTADGDKALELVRRGDISGCSFAFSTRYFDDTCVTPSHEVVEGREVVTYHVRVITGIYDFTLAADPAYPDTSVDARELARKLRANPEAKEPEKPAKEDKAERERIDKQISEMRLAASRPLI